MKRRLNLTTTLARGWFPAALILLLLFALPALVLLAIHLFGQETEVNQWLQKHFNVSYHLPIPWWAGLLLLLIPPLLVLLYFLKLKRKPLHVPSTFLWKKSVEDLHVNSLFQWLRENVLLLLQLLTLLALVYTLLAFQLHGVKGEGEHYIILIDNSASMAATDAAPSRLHEAKKMALAEIDSHGDNDAGMVIKFSSSAEILQSYTSDKGLLRAAVDRIEQTQRTTQIEEALSFADSLANPHNSTEEAVVKPDDVEPGKERSYAPPEGMPTVLHLFSDGGFDDVPKFSLGNLSIQYHAVGVPGPKNVDNVGIVTLSASRNEKDPSTLEVLVGVNNYGPEEKTAIVRLEVIVNGEVQGEFHETANLPERKPKPAAPEAHADKAAPGDSAATDRPGEGFVTFSGARHRVLKNLDDQSSVVLHAQLADHHDQFPLDDEAWLVIGVMRRARVLIVGDPNPALLAFFENNPAARKIATTTYLSPDDLKNDAKYRKPALNGDYDLVIFDRCAPAKQEDLPLANTYFIDSVPPPWKRSDMPPLENPDIRGRLKEHPLFRYVPSVQEIGLTEAFRFDLKDPRVPPRTPKLIETDKETAVLFTLSRQSFTDLVMTFPILNDKGEWTTTWPVKLGFPLFLTNVVYVLGNVNDGTSDPIVRPGDVKPLRPDRAVKRIEVEDPDGKTHTLARGARADFLFGETDKVGVYKVKWDGQEQYGFAVNLLDARESNLEPRTDIDIGEERFASGETHSPPREIWKWVALAALLLLLLEWYIYNRRVYV
jgi:hypothetical protein